MEINNAKNRKVLLKSDGLLYPDSNNEILKESGDNPTLYRYFSTKEAAAYLGRSVSWLLRQSSIPYLRGKPNMYSAKDLDDWFEANKYIPLS